MGPGDTRLSQWGAGASSAYPVVSSAMEYEQTMTTGMEMGSRGSVGGASELHGPAYSSMQTNPAVVPSSSSSFHFGDGFFDSPGFGGWGAAPTHVPCTYGRRYGGPGWDRRGSPGVDESRLVWDVVECSLGVRRPVSGGFWWFFVDGTVLMSRLK